MKFNAKGWMRSNPDFHLDADMAPLDFDLGVTGSFQATINAISGSVSEIPVKMAIPFLRRKEKQQVVASIGGFDLRLNPFNFQVKDAGIRLDGVVGKKGLKTSLDGKIGCNTEMNLKGGVDGKLGSVTMNFGDDPAEEETEK